MKPKLCQNCQDAAIQSGSAIFYLCKKTGRYRSIADVCDLGPKEQARLLKEQKHKS